MPAQKFSAPPAMALKPNQRYQARIETDLGDILVDLHADLVPVTVNNFVFLARQGFYGGVIFHRVIANFMAQTGDPTGTGTGGPGYQFKDEFDQTLRHAAPGVLSMANAGPNTNGSQFFLTHVATPWLDGKHSVFGHVVGGMDVLMSIPVRDPGNRNAPAVAIRRIEILEA